MTVGETTIEVCLRSAATGPVQRRQRRVLERVADLASDGLIDDVAVVRWSDEDAPATGGSVGDGFPRAVSDLLVLADAMELVFAPADESDGRTRTRGTDGASIPAIATLVREDGTIVGTYPIEYGGQRYPVEDCLAALEAGERAANLTALLAGRD